MQYATLRRTAQSRTRQSPPLPPHFVLTFSLAIGSVPELQTQPSFLWRAQTSQQIPQAATCSKPTAYFNMGILTLFSFATFWALSYPASACLTTAVPGSVVRTVTMRFSASLVPSATKHMPACML